MLLGNLGAANGQTTAPGSIDQIPSRPPPADWRRSNRGCVNGWACFLARRGSPACAGRSPADRPDSRGEDRTKSSRPEQRRSDRRSPGRRRPDREYHRPRLQPEPRPRRPRSPNRRRRRSFSAPPMVPGIPDRNSSHRCRRPAPRGATFTSSAGRAGVSVSASTAVMLANPRPSRMTPGMPPSRTSRLEPTPRTVIATPVGFAAMNAARSLASAGRNITSAGPPTRNQVIGARGIFGIASAHLRKPVQQRGRLFAYRHHAAARAVTTELGDLGRQRARPAPCCPPQDRPRNRRRSPVRHDVGEVAPIRERNHPSVTM